MAIDVQMHVVRNDQDILDYKIANKSSTSSSFIEERRKDPEKVEQSISRLSESPSVWIGTLPNNINVENPDPVTMLLNMIGDDFPLLTSELYKDMVTILEKAEDTYLYQVAEISSIKEFFDEHNGNHVFLMKW